MPYIECPSLSSFILDAWPDALASTAQTAATRSVIIVRHLQLLRELSYYVPRRAPPARRSRCTPVYAARGTVHGARALLAAPRVHASPRVAARTDRPRGE